MPAVQEQRGARILETPWAFRRPTRCDAGLGGLDAGGWQRKRGAFVEQPILRKAKPAQGFLMDFNEIEILEVTARIAGVRAHEPLADIEAGGLKGGRRDRSRRAMHPADDKNGRVGHVSPARQARARRPSSSIA